MYWNIFDNNRYELLKKITETVSIQDYYMIGGTALALQTGTRQSFDFDFCIQTHFNNEILLEELKKMGTVEILQNQNGTCDITLDDVQVSFFYYPNKVIKEFVQCREMPKLKLASIVDIGAMKLAAIGGRGAKKDFFDLYNILTASNVSIRDITKAFIEKNNSSVNFLNTIMGLSYFEDADVQELPLTYIKYDWEQIKEYFIKIQPEVQKYLEECRTEKENDYGKQSFKSVGGTKKYGA